MKTPKCRNGHNYRKYGRRNGNQQQYRCTRCGRLKNRKVRGCGWLMGHRWRLDRRRKGTQMVCRRCGQVKVIDRTEQERDREQEEE